MNDPWRLTRHAARLLAVDPAGLGGALLRGRPNAARDAWLATLRGTLPATAPWRRMPPTIAEDRLRDGIDLAATLAAGRPIVERGLLAQAAGGAIIVPNAERLEAGAAALLAGGLERGTDAPVFTAVLLDEGDGPPAILAERLAFHLDLDALTGDVDAPAEDAGEAALPIADVHVGDDALEAICAAALAFGVPSLRASSFAINAARACAALAGRASVAAEDLAMASALVLAPRATRLPATDVPPAPEPEQDASDAAGDDTGRPDQPGDAPEIATDQPLADQVLDATRAAIPARLLAELEGREPARAVSGGRGGAAKAAANRGRPAGVRRAMPARGSRLALVATLRAAAPWQRLRRRNTASGTDDRILVRRDDFRVVRTKARSESVTIFVVDASGSAALHRLAEVKGAVELILAECYARRDGVALIAFRGTRADLVLPPTRSLARAKRALAGQAGGGATPLATALEAASRLADDVGRKGRTPLVVLLTDGKANMSRDGRPGRAAAEADAFSAARVFATSGVAGLVLDIAPRPSDAARHLAAKMNARYVPLPHADARIVSQAVLSANG